MTRIVGIATLVSSLAVAPALAQSSRVAIWRAQHEKSIVDELVGLIAIPNVAGAGADADLRRNAERLEQLFVRRGFVVEKTDDPGAPVVFARLDTPAARGTLTLYIHYDGQPVNPAQWPIEMMAAIFTMVK